MCCSGHDSCLLPQGLVDVLLFNPPYVPTPSAEVGGSGIEASWAGGDRGREVIDRLIPAIKVVNVLAQCGFSRAAHTTLCVQDMLSPHGVFYMLVVQDNDPDEIAQLFAKDGLACEVSCLAAWTRLVGVSANDSTQTVIKRKAMNERLSILKIQHKTAKLA